MNALYCALFVLMAVATVHSSPTLDRDCEVKAKGMDLVAYFDEGLDSNNKSFVFYKESIHWALAQMKCILNKKSLATILSQTEQDKFVADRTAQGVTTGELWVAGFDTANNDNFKWVPKQTPFSYTNWASDYPQTSQGYQCVFLADDSTWKNADCSSQRYYACQERS